jgi:hypothetical protein
MHLTRISLRGGAGRGGRVPVILYVLEQGKTSADKGGACILQATLGELLTSSYVSCLPTLGRRVARNAKEHPGDGDCNCYDRGQ